MESILPGQLSTLRVPPTGAARVRRGGGWFSHGGLARAAQRDADVPGDRYHFVGFRLPRGQGRWTGSAGGASNEVRRQGRTGGAERSRSGIAGWGNI
jgi:hypothetical protein